LIPKKLRVWDTNIWELEDNVLSSRAKRGDL
jgi:hypothetical protein